MNNFLFKLTIYIITMVMIIGCGGGGSSSDSPKDEGISTNSSLNSDPSINWSPKTTNITCDLSSIDGGTYSALGDLSISCQKDNLESIKYELQNVKSLTAIQVVKHKYLTIEKSSDKLHTIYDYEKGTISYNGTIEGVIYSCIETYPSIIPETLTNSSIEKILNWHGDSNDRITTTCTDSFYNSKIDSTYNDISQIKSLSFFGINYTITDDSGTQHFITDILHN